MFPDLNLKKQLKRRRLELGLKQNDMPLRIGMSRQQYQRLESSGNPRLETLELIAKGLKCEILLIPQEKLDAVKAILENKDYAAREYLGPTGEVREGNAIADDPWQDLLSGSAE